MTDQSSPMRPDRRRFLAGSLGTAGLMGTGALAAGALISGCADGGAEGPTTTTAVAPRGGTPGPPPIWPVRVAATEPAVERTAAGFEVRWTSPSSGAIAFGSTGDFTVDGEVQPLADFPRHDSRFGTVDRLARTYELTSDHARLHLDFDQQTRTML